MISVQSLTFQYEGSSEAALHDISLQIKEGGFFGIIGPAGAGKTTLLKMIANLATPTSGTYSIYDANGQKSPSMRSKIGVLIELDLIGFLRITPGRISSAFYLLEFPVIYDIAILTDHSDRT